MQAIRQISRKNRMLFKLERIRDGMKKSDPARIKVEMYHHHVACDHFNEAGMLQADNFLQIMGG